MIPTETTYPLFYHLFPSDETTQKNHPLDYDTKDDLFIISFLIKVERLFFELQNLGLIT